MIDGQDAAQAITAPANARSDGAVATYPLPALIDAPPAPARRPGKWRPVMVLALIMILTTGALYHVISGLQRPVLASAPDEATIGAVLAAGGLYHADAEQLNHRALIASRIRHLTDTPDVVVIADRSWQLLQQDLRWEQRVFGAYVDSLEPDDVLAILAEFSAAGRMPEKIVLGISPDYLLRKGAELKLATVEVTGDPQDATAPLATTQGQIWVDRDPALRPQPGIAPYHATLDTIYPDGSVIWSAQRARAFARRDAEADANDLVRQLRQKIKATRLDQIVETGEIIADAKSNGIDVVVVLTPLHPAVYGQIYNQQAAFRLHEGVEDLLAVARALDVETLGSFEPFAAGCKEADFATVSVPAASCLSRLLNAGFVAGSAQITRDQMLSELGVTFEKQ